MAKVMRKVSRKEVKKEKEIYVGEIEIDVAEIDAADVEIDVVKKLM